MKIQETYTVQNRLSNAESSKKSDTRSALQVVSVVNQTATLETNIDINIVTNSNINIVTDSNINIVTNSNIKIEESACIPISEEDIKQSSTLKFKAWIEENIDALSNTCQCISESLSSTYETINPLLILQCKLGSSIELGTMGAQTASLWAQNGFQINIISRGINLGDTKPILQFFLHNEAGISCVAGGMTVLNTGICLVPNEEGHYSINDTSFMTEEVHRLDYGDSVYQHSANKKKISLNLSVGVDVLEHTYWANKNKWIAGAAISAAQAVGTAAGWVAGSFLETAAGPLAALDHATTPYVGITTTPLSTISLMNQSPTKYQWSDLGGALGGIFTTKCMIGLMKSTPYLAPSSTLSMKELTFGIGEFGFEMPLSDGKTLYLVAFPRLNLTSINKNQLTNESVSANPRVTKKKENEISNVEVIVITNDEHHLKTTPATKL